VTQVGLRVFGRGWWWSTRVSHRGRQSHNRCVLCVRLVRFNFIAKTLSISYPLLGLFQLQTRVTIVFSDFPIKIAWLASQCYFFFLFPQHIFSATKQTSLVGFNDFFCCNFFLKEHIEVGWFQFYSYFVFSFAKVTHEVWWFSLNTPHSSVLASVWFYQMHLLFGIWKSFVSLFVLTWKSKQKMKGIN
jgi:hypothetical protein